METGKPTNRIHPLIATAAVAVTLVSLIGIAAITGLLPNSQGGSAPTPVVSASAPPATEAPPVIAAGTPKEAHRSSAARSAPVRSRAAEPAPVRQPAPVAQAPICGNCGRIESIQAVQQAAQPSGLGIAAGAVVGGLLGNQVGGGRGRTLATVAGAVGGGYAGNEVEKRTRSTTTYEIRVRMEDGSLRTFPQSSPNGWQVGDPVRVVNGELTMRG